MPPQTPDDSQLQPSDPSAAVPDLSVTPSVDPPMTTPDLGIAPDTTGETVEITSPVTPPVDLDTSVATASVPDTASAGEAEVASGTAPVIGHTFAPSVQSSSDVVATEPETVTDQPITDTEVSTPPVVPEAPASTAEEPLPTEPVEPPTTEDPAAQDETDDDGPSEPPAPLDHNPDIVVG